MKKRNEPVLKFLGRGSMFNVKEGNTSAYYKTWDNECMILIDCGCTVFSKIQEKNVLDGVESLAIIITHTHTDHIGSLSDLIYFCIFCKPEMEVSIIAYNKTMIPLKQYLDCTGTTAVIQQSKNVEIKALVNTGKIVHSSTEVCTVEFIPDRSHIVPSPLFNVSGTYNCGILLKFKDITIYYSGDTQKIPYNSLDIDNIDELYVDCAVREHSPGSDKPYPHYVLYNLVNDLNDLLYPLDQVYVMHLDCDGVIDECEHMGITVVKNI